MEPRFTFFSLIIVICSVHFATTAPITRNKEISTCQSNCSKDTNFSCGADGFTYANDCHRKCFGIAEIHDGPCSNQSESVSSPNPETQATQPPLQLILQLPYSLPKVAELPKMPAELPKFRGIPTLAPLVINLSVPDLPKIIFEHLLPAILKMPTLTEAEGPSLPKLVEIPTPPPPPKLPTPSPLYISTD